MRRRTFKTREKKAARGSSIIRKGRKVFAGRGKSAMRLLSKQIGEPLEITADAEGNFNPQDIFMVIKAGMGQATERIALEFRSAAVRMLSRAGSGRMYRGGRKGKGMKRRRSAPGEPPAVDTGTLRRSVQTARTSPTVEIASTGETIGAQLQGVKKYGFYLDRGVEDHPLGVVIKPRPWIQPSLAAVQGKVERIALSYINQALARATKQRLMATKG